MELNYLLIAAGLLLVIKMADGYKKGMVKEVIALVTLILTSIMVALIANGLKNYTSGHVVNVIIVLVLLSLLGAVNLLLKPIFFSAKMISKLPIVNWLDKLLGIAFGAAEIVLLLWTLYFFVMIMELGAIGQQILKYTEQSEVLLWFFRHNYLAEVLQKISENITFLPELL